MKKTKTKHLVRSFKLTFAEKERWDKLTKAVGFRIPFSEVVVEALNALCDARGIPGPGAVEQTPPALFQAIDDKRNGHQEPSPATSRPKAPSTTRPAPAIARKAKSKKTLTPKGGKKKNG